MYKIFFWNALMLSLLAGCEQKLPVAEVVSENTASVSGKVTVKGRPLSSGHVMFFSLSNGNSAQAELSGQGEFTMQEQIPAVEYQVYFTDHKGLPHSGVAPKYQSETSTDYTVTVTPGVNQLSIEIP